MMKDRTDSKKIIAFAAILIIALLLMLNSFSYHTIDFELRSENISDITNLKEYSPHMTFPKGEYNITISGNGNIEVVSVDGTLLGEGQAGISFTIKLDKDESDIIIYGDTVSNLTSAVVNSKRNIFHDLGFMTILVFVAMLYLIYLKFYKKEQTEDDTVFIILMFTAIFASYPLFTSYVAYGQDLNFHMWRIEGIKDGLLSGQFPVRVDPSINNGYGYITSIMYPEMFLYIPAILRIFGVSAVTAYKTLILLANIATVFIMYYSAKGISKSKFVAVIASIIYTLSVWKLYNTYFRAALGEALAMVFFPLVIYGLYELFKGNRKKWWVLSVGVTCIIQTHFISCFFVVMLSAFCLLVFYKDIKEDKRWIEFIKAILAVILINLWYIIPFIYTYLNVNMNIQHKPINTEFYRNAIIPAQLFNVFSDTFASHSKLIPAGIKDDMSFSIGFGVTACLVVTAYYFILDNKNKLENKKFIFRIFMFGIAVLFMTTTLFPWKLIQESKLINIIVGTIQFPWRMLSIVSPIIVITGSIILGILIKPENKKSVLMIVLGVCILTSLPFLTAYTTQQDIAVTKGTMIPNAGAPGWDNEYFILGTNISGLEPEKYETSDSLIQIISYEKRGTNIELELSEARDDDYVEVPLLYYPGYSAKDTNGNKLDIVPGTNNVLRVQLQDGSDNIRIKYSGLIIFKIGCIISLLTMALAIFYIYCRKKGIQIGYNKTKN